LEPKQWHTRRDLENGIKWNKTEMIK